MLPTALFSKTTMTLPVLPLLVVLLAGTASPAAGLAIPPGLPRVGVPRAHIEVLRMRAAEPVRPGAVAETTCLDPNVKIVFHDENAAQLAIFDQDSSSSTAATTTTITTITTTTTTVTAKTTSVYGTAKFSLAAVRAQHAHHHPPRVYPRGYPRGSGGGGWGWGGASVKTETANTASPATIAGLSGARWERCVRAARAVCPTGSLRATCIGGGGGGGAEDVVFTLTRP